MKVDILAIVENRDIAVILVHPAILGIAVTQARELLDTRVIVAQVR